MELVSRPDFPNSFADPFQKTSEETDRYNCIAHAIFNDSDWYEPAHPKYLAYWPEDVRFEYSIEAYMELFEYCGFTKCDNGDLEPEYIKVAFFYSQNKYNNPDSFHAARLLPDGLWTSKLGPGIDVSHSLNSISSGSYGEVIQFFKKRIAAPL